MYGRGGFGHYLHLRGIHSCLDFIDPDSGLNLHLKCLVFDAQSGRKGTVRRPNREKALRETPVQGESQCFLDILNNRHQEEDILIRGCSSTQDWPLALHSKRTTGSVLRVHSLHLVLRGPYGVLGMEPN